MKSRLLPLLSHSPSYSTDSQNLVSALAQIHWFPSFQQFVFVFCLFVWSVFSCFCFPFLGGGGGRVLTVEGLFYFVVVVFLFGIFVCFNLFLILALVWSDIAVFPWSSVWLRKNKSKIKIHIGWFLKKQPSAPSNTSSTRNANPSQVIPFISWFSERKEEPGEFTIRI